MELACTGSLAGAVRSIEFPNSDDGSNRLGAGGIREWVKVSVLRITSVLALFGFIMRMKHLVSKFETSPSGLFRPQPARPTKNQGETGPGFPAGQAAVSKNGAGHRKSTRRA